MCLPPHHDGDHPNVCPARTYIHQGLTSDDTYTTPTENTQQLKGIRMRTDSRQRHIQHTHMHSIQKGAWAEPFTCMCATHLQTCTGWQVVWRCMWVKDRSQVLIKMILYAQGSSSNQPTCRNRTMYHTVTGVFQIRTTHTNMRVENDNHTPNKANFENRLLSYVAPDCAPLNPDLTIHPSTCSQNLCSHGNLFACRSL